MAVDPSAHVLELFQTGLLTIPAQIGGDFLYFAVVFFILAILAAALGASGIAGVTMTVAKWFVIIFIVLAVISLLL